MMIQIEKLREPFDPAAVHAIADRYRSGFRYRVTKQETPEHTTIALVLEPVDPPIEVQWTLTEWDLDLWRRCAAHGLALGAYDSGRVVGFCIGQVERWNGALRVWEIGVARSHRRRGIGGQLIERAAGFGRAAGCRIMVCETQNTNVPAIAFYRKMGFELEGVDLSLYTNDDLSETGQVALLVKRKLLGSDTTAARLGRQQTQVRGSEGEVRGRHRPSPEPA